MIAFDNQGVRGSSGAVPMSILAMATQALAFLDTLGLARIRVFALSMGGFIAQELIAQRPGYAEKLVLAGTGPEAPLP